MRHPIFHSPSEVYFQVLPERRTVIYTNMFSLEPSESAILWICWSQVNILYSWSFTSACRSYSWFCITKDENWIVRPLSDLLTWKTSSVKHSEFSFFQHLDELWGLWDLARMHQCIALSLCMCICIYLYIYIYVQQNCGRLYLRETASKLYLTLHCFPACFFAV